MKKPVRTPLIDERKRRQWSQQEVADRLGTTRTNIGRWEQGQTTPGPYFRAKLCEIFGKSAQELGLFSEPSASDDQLPATDPSQMPLALVDQSLSLWTVPFPRNPHFTGRDACLDQLDQHFPAESLGEQVMLHRAALTQPQAIKGLGGIGKTQIAVEYAYRSREQDRYIHTLWINAAGQETVMASFTALADLLPAFPARNETDQRKLVVAITRWLEECPQRWLLIFDNADDLALTQEYLPQYGNGSILLTTRASAVGAFAASVEVETMSFVEGTQLLLRRAQRLKNASDEEVNEAGNIVVALDHFPLALDQAGAYIEETRCGFSTYLQLYQDHRQALLARRGAQATHYPDSVATTWSLSFQRIEQANPAAAELLQLCAFLAPDHIPEELLTDGRDHWPPVLQQATADLFAFNLMLKDLLSFSLVKRLAEQQTLSLHRLVQVVQMDAMEPEEQRQWAERVVRAVNTVFPRNPKEEIATWPQCQRHLEQVQACDTLIQQHLLLLPEAADLLDRTGTYLRERACYTLAEPLYHRALRIWEQQLEPEDLQMAAPLNHLAELYREQGKYAQAEPLYHRALHIYEQQLEPEDFQVVPPLNNLAILYYAQGKYAQAEPLYHRALRICEQLLGSEHLKVAYLLTNLALLYVEQNKYAQAEPLYHRALAIREQQLGLEDPQVAYPLTNLANLYYEQGKYAQAEPLYHRALAIREKQLGPEDPQVAYPLNNLAELYREQGKYAQAEPLYHRALAIREQQLGPEHPLVASTIHGLAQLYLQQRRYEEAESLYQQALHIREQQLGIEHPDTADSLHDLATFRKAQGNLQEAALLYQRAQVIREHVFGAQHPKTLATRTAYIALLQERDSCT